jgi:S-adenosylmethionine:tRNA ribosyltransferase-isomerase
VGAGTFKPVKSADMGGHVMHTEHVSVSRHLLERLLAHQCQAVAVGTTSVRTLESLYYMGLHVIDNPECTEQQLHVGQWEPYDTTLQPMPSTEQALTALVGWMDAHDVDRLHASTQIIIEPGYKFHIVRQLITNFHQPQSTLLLLVSAFTHGNWRPIYQHALSHGYRFLSYGDSSILKF